jgi:hypothetical protein
MDERRLRRAEQLAQQFNVYRGTDSPWTADFNEDTLSRVHRVLTSSLPPHLPTSEDPFPPSWPIDRSVLNKAVKDFLRLTSHLPYIRTIQR